MKCFITVRDEVWCYVTGLLPSHVDILHKEFAIFVDGYFFMPAYKLGRFDGKIKFFEKTGKTYVRLLDRIVPRLEQWGYDIELVDNRIAVKSPSILASETMMGDIEVFGKPFKLRPYQVDIVQTMLDAGSGFCVAGTGSGKCLSGSTLINIKVTRELKEAIEYVRINKTPKEGI